MQYSLAFHIVGMVFWLGGLIILSRLAARADSTEAQAAVRRLWRAYALPGSLIVLLSGIVQLFSRGVAFYMAQGWMHLKLTLVIVLAVVTLVVHLELSAIASGRPPRRAKLGACHGISALLLLVLVFLMKLSVVS